VKHPINTTLILIILFLLSQLVGVFVINNYINNVNETGEVEYRELPFGQQRPEVENKSVSFIYVAIAVFIGTLILLGLIWKIWFFLAVWLAMMIAFSTFMPDNIALIVALLLGAWKIWKPNVLVHNISEIFIYAGIAAIIVPILNIFAAAALLILISIYDYWAVFKSKHMVKLAQASTEAKIFPGLHVSYAHDKKKEQIFSPLKKLNLKKDSKKELRTVKNKIKVTSAILGGGDIAFALLFTGAALAHFYSNPLAILKTLIIVAFSTIGITTIFFLGKKGKFYPAMPFVTLGCLLGYGIAWLI
jgi:presenilin-like A22 family membrane protease